MGIEYSANMHTHKKDNAIFKKAQERNGNIQEIQMDDLGNRNVKT